MSAFPASSEYRVVIRDDIPLAPPEVCTVYLDETGRPYHFTPVQLRGDRHALLDALLGIRVAIARVPLMASNITGDFTLTMQENK